MIQDLSVGCADSYPVHDVYIFADSSHKNGVTICDHDIVGVIEAIPSGGDRWRGFFLAYHCGNEPWKDARWEIKDLGEFLEQIEVVVASAPEHIDKDKITKLLNFLRHAHKNGEGIFLECQ